jgi:hypothetical protein
MKALHLSRRSLNASGFSHIIVPLIIIVGMGLFGTFYLVLTHAAAPSGSMQLSEGVKGFCLDDFHSGSVNYSKADVWTCNKTKAQAWTLSSTTSSTGGTITNANGLCLDVYHSGTTTGTKVDLFKCNKTTAQNWVISGTKLTNPHANLCLTNTGSSTTKGTQVTLATCTSSKAQAWTVAAQGTTTGGGGSGSSTTGGGGSGTGGGGAFPGQSGNPVGYAAYGSLGKTAWSGSNFVSGTASNPTVYKGYVFNGTQKISGSYIKFVSCDFVGGASITGSNLTFTGDRFQSNSLAYFNVNTNGANLTFTYDSFTPLAKFYTSPPGEVWPSAGSGQNTYHQTANVNAINGNEGYQFAITVGGGPTTIDHSDFWGFGNAITFGGSTTQMKVTNNWIHDAADAGPQQYHTDGPGYLNGGGGPSNVLIQGNTIASLGNTNGIAFQAATSGYNNMQIIGNYLSGFGYTVAPGFPGTHHFTNSSFESNVFGTDVEAIWGALYSWTDTGNNVWKCNKYNFRAGTNWTNGNNWKPQSSMDGKYWLPSSGPSSTDYKGNTTCS